MEVPEPIRQNQELLRQSLYESVKHFVWVLEIKSKDEEGMEWINTLSASMVDQSGYLMTCAHGDWINGFGLTTKARPLCGLPGFRYDADVVEHWSKADMCLFKLRNCQVDDKSVAKFGSGNLSVCDPIFLVGHPEDFVGSGVLGSVAYPCTENAPASLDSPEICGTYKCDELSVTPQYRIMGHVWNKFVFETLKKQKSRENYEFQEELLAPIPIIQCSNLVGGFGASGGPLFNSEGEIVGMMVGTSGGFGIGIHVVAIKDFLSNFPDVKGYQKVEEMKGLSRGEGRKQKSEEPGL